MDIEQLRLVLEAINSVGGEAKEFGFWWLACRMVSPLLLFIFGMTAVFVVSRRVHQGITTSSLAAQVADEVGYVVHCYWDTRDVMNVLERVRRLRRQSEKTDG